MVLLSMYSSHIEWRRRFRVAILWNVIRIQQVLCEFHRDHDRNDTNHCSPLPKYMGDGAANQNQKRIPQNAIILLQKALIHATWQLKNNDVVEKTCNTKYQDVVGYIHCEARSGWHTYLEKLPVQQKSLCCRKLSLLVTKTKFGNNSNSS